MTLNLNIPQQTYADFTPRITVIGVGGGGTNAVDNMILSRLQGVDFVVANTDAQQLSHSAADRRVQLGPHLTQGLGAGAKPEIGRAAAEEAADELARHMDGAHMVFITAGMGGGTGTGAAPVIARMARERGILTVGVVTKPFTFEGVRRSRAAEAGLAELQQYVDTLIVIPNQNLFRLANERTGWKEAFKMADHVLYMGVRGVTDLMVAPGLVNLDFADIRTVMAEMGKAMMGTGEAEGENRAIIAAEAAISNPLLEDTSMAGARGLLINITGGEDMTLFEVDQAANRIREEVAEDANIIFGSAIDEELSGKIRVSVVATGIDSPAPNSDQAPTQVAVPGDVPHAAADSAAGQHGTDMSGLMMRPASNLGQPSQRTETLSHHDRASAFAAQFDLPPDLSRGSGIPPHAGHGTGGHEPGPMQAPPPDTVPQHMQGARSNERSASPRSGLFTEAPRQTTQEQQPAPSRGGLFGIVTGALRRNGPAPTTAGQQTESHHAAPQQQPAPPRREPAVSQEGEVQPPSPRKADADDIGLDIPAFLRRQSN